MSKKTVKYTKGDMGKSQVVPDFLPEPKSLALREETVKVTLSLTKESVEFFKQQADKHHANYQTMIRNLLTKYAAHYDDQEKTG
ncbi:MAG: CopG family transcriptional regulator [Gammaproteobacteria bacterium]|nr:CopG family transcriptional regulator [Gammaproteobacteria bacterium]